MALMVRPETLKKANEYVARYHRHHKPVIGHRFSLSAWKGGIMLGVAICGRPVARRTDQYLVLEVLRLCTSGHKNACSFLYGACARVAKEMGFVSIQTFILASETGTTLKAAGWSYCGESAGKSWSVPSRKRKDKHPIEKKHKWEKVLNLENYIMS